VGSGDRAKKRLTEATATLRSSVQERNTTKRKGGGKERESARRRIRFGGGGWGEAREVFFVCPNNEKKVGRYPLGKTGFE